MRLLLVFCLGHGYVLNLSGVPCGLCLSIYHCPAQVVDATTVQEEEHVPKMCQLFKRWRGGYCLPCGIKGKHLINTLRGIALHQVPHNEFGLDKFHLLFVDDNQWGVFLQPR